MRRARHTPQRVLITGGAGFIGANLVHHLIDTEPEVCIVNLDKLTYAGRREHLEGLSEPERHHLVEGDICDRALVDTLLETHQIDTVIHLAAESHVDRSIDGPAVFVQTNVVGTATLLEAARAWWQRSGHLARGACRFHQVSTDEVYGSLTAEDPPFTEASPYQPSSPYAASKAGADHLARAWHHTFGLPVTITSCSNNYGPRQHTEKLIPTVIARCLEGAPIPVYGDGSNVRDWLYVGDHCEALWSVICHAEAGSTFNVGGRSERSNLEMVERICALMDARHPAGAPHHRLISFVTDRPGHDWRYAIDPQPLEQATGWRPATPFDTGLARTLDWYLAQPGWRAAAEGGAGGVRLGLEGRT